MGREPGVAERKAVDKIDLPPGSATMNDCCRITELLLGGGSGGTLPLTSGILEIVCTRELSVSATYTVTSGSGKIDIDVAQIPSRRT